jgi:phosphoribosyl 1,2-cyclic phosphate phosphodiesterase
MRVTFLGTGTSRGIPVVGCECAVCGSSDPRDKRLRSSILIEGDATILIDTSVDFRQQMLRAGVRGLDAVVFTHHHADHILGLDDVFPYTVRARRALPIYADARTLDELRITFRHLFKEVPQAGVARLEPHVITGDFQIGSLTFRPVELFHGGMPVLGFRIGSFAYLTDVNRIPEASFSKLRDLECLVLDGLRFHRHPTHYSIEEAVQVAGIIGARQTYLIHMTHDVAHAATSRNLPSSVELAYDGLILDFDGEPT